MFEKDNNLVGILGGMGPQATAYFYQLIIKHTLAKLDGDHVDVVISGMASTPDRTAHILNRSNPDPKDFLVRDLGRLVKFSAKAIAIPCNTAHFFYEDLVNACDVPIFNMIKDTVKLLHLMDVNSVGILATEGTIASGLYQRELNKNSIQYIVPCPNNQAHVTEIIYEQVKKGNRVDMDLFKRVVDGLGDGGCQAVILGCTELSILKGEEGLNNEFYIDPLETLAYRVIDFAGKMATGFNAKMCLLNSDNEKKTDGCKD